MKQLLRSFFDAVEKICAYAAGACLIGMVALSFMQVILRYVFDSPSTWSEELVRYLGIWMTFIGAPVAIRRGELVAVEMLSSRLSSKYRAVLFYISKLFSTAFLLILITYGFELTRFSLQTGQKTAAMLLPIAYVYAILPIGGIAMLLQQIAVIFGLTTSVLITKEGDLR